MSERCTIVGGQGFVGSALSRRLRSLGWDCYVPTRAEIPALSGDLGHVFYCAGLTADYLKRPLDTIEAHVSLVSRILANTSYNSLVYLSSTRLYDSSPTRLGVEDQDLLFNPGNLRHLYDLSKSLGEAACLALGHGKARAARLSCVYNDHTDADGFLPTLLRDVLHQREHSPSEAFVVDSSPHYERDYVHLNDVVEGLVLIATQGRQPVYNVASGRNVTNAELFAELERLTGVHITPSSNRQGAEAVSVSIERMRGDFGWDPVDVTKRIGEIIHGCTVA